MISADHLKISPEFQKIDKALSPYSLADFSDRAKVKSYVAAFGLDELFADSFDAAYDLNRDAVSMTADQPVGPAYDDLCRLHFLALKYRRTSVLEFGSGCSTVVLADAMRLLGAHFENWVSQNTRVLMPFQVVSVEESHRFAQVTRQRLGAALGERAEVVISSVEPTIYQGRYATVYHSLPNLSPDLIYLDGPSQAPSTKTLNGFDVGHPTHMPMSADLLLMEFFLEPGTLIVVDGRSANARFLKAYFRRNWVYWHDESADIHLFELQEEPLGKFNRLKLAFSNAGNWVL